MKNFLSSVIIFSFFAISCNPEPLVFSGVQGVKLEDVDIQKGNVAAELGLKIKNPNGFSVTVYSVDLDLILAGVSFGNVTLKDEFNIEKDSESVYPVKINAQLKDIMRSGANIISAVLKKEAKVEVKGTVKAGHGIFKKDFPINFSQENVETLMAD
jgi:LEA14-like dessication related protein